ncbi:hypothetical protein [Petroclostridium sp. X23]|uniref:hypothetical protein n=1 Tax=Petroclostridium sp. X23 TaxID=3045146 RepID=UPI0024AC88D7|nr:hypothetical protein [Petroclostridium sp. X23]WHH57189.1 hypothetical protein QKW49_15230 [Petroclostridium sp. X23]
MYVYDSNTIDNYNVLKNVKDEIGESNFNNLIMTWKRGISSEFETFLFGSEFSYVRELINALNATIDIAESLVSDGLFGIYIGLVPENNIDDTYLPVYFIFRCTNNGRSTIVSPVPLFS